jgi:hypothetical protein
MAISLASLRTSTVLSPPRVLIHGVAGIGKSTFAASADAPVFVLTEDGLGKLQVPHFPLATSYAEVAEALDALLDEDHAYSTVVVDSVDWLEPLIWAEACRRNGWQSIESPGFGKGYAEALTIWREYIDRLNALRDRKGMAVIQIAHTDIKRFDSPEHEPYDRYVIKLQARASALLQSTRTWCSSPTTGSRSASPTSALTRKSPGRSGPGRASCTPKSAPPSSPRTATACRNPSRSSGRSSWPPCPNPPDYD